MAQIRKIKVSEIIEREEKIEKIFIPYFSHDTLQGYMPAKNIFISIKLKDEFNTIYHGNFNPGTEPHQGQELNLKYVGEIRKALGLYKLEDQRGFVFTY